MKKENEVEKTRESKLVVVTTSFVTGFCVCDPPWVNANSNPKPSE